MRLDGLSRRYANLGFDGIVLNGVVVVVFDKRFDESKSISVANENILFGRNIPSFPRFNDGEFKRSVDELYVDVAAAADDDD